MIKMVTHQNCKFSGLTLLALLSLTSLTTGQASKRIPRLFGKVDDSIVEWLEDRQRLEEKLLQEIGDDFDSSDALRLLRWACPRVPCPPVPESCSIREHFVYTPEYRIGDTIVTVPCQSCLYCLDEPLLSTRSFARVRRSIDKPFDRVRRSINKPFARVRRSINKPFDRVRRSINKPFTRVRRSSSSSFTWSNYLKDIDNKSFDRGRSGPNFSPESTYDSLSMTSRSDELPTANQRLNPCSRFRCPDLPESCPILRSTAVRVRGSICRICPTCYPDELLQHTS